MTHKPTIKDVARLAGVSLGTASRVLNGSSATSEASRSAVHNAAHELGYLSNAHARSLRSSHSGVIGLVVPDIRNPYFAELASVVENACLAHGWATLLCNADESPDQFNRYVNTLRRQRVDGAIVTPTGSGGQAVKDLVDDGVQVVCVDREITGSPLPAVTSDPWNGMRQAVDHLVDHGHRRIGFITGPQQTSTGLERYQAYRQLLAEHGLEVDEDLVVEGDFQEESGRGGARRLLDGGATAIFASDSLMSMGALRTCIDQGIRIGDEIDLVGFDDLPVFSLTNPALTVGAQDIDAMGKVAVDLLNRAMSGELTSCARLDTHYIVRASTRMVKENQ